MLLILLTLIAGTLASEPASTHHLIGCENDPCQQQCVDTVSSYYCLCHENFVLQPDGHTCLHKNTEALENAYLGCWADNDTRRDLPYLIWTRPDDATIPECTHDCRSRGFEYAGLQGGDQCWCGSNYERMYDGNQTCDIPCPGAPAQHCGGQLVNAIYKVTRDERYMGCFYETFDSPDLPTLLWGPYEGRSVDNCITECSKQGFNYSGVFGGGQCSCGNSFGKYGLAGEEACNGRCYNGWWAHNCGGNETNAIYRVSKGRDYSALKAAGVVKDVENRVEMGLSGIFLYPNYMGLYTKRFMIYASDTVNNLEDDLTCSTGECYSICGEISMPNGFDKYREDVVLRRFHIRLSEIADLIEYPDDAQRVWLYAQTLYIDTSVDFPWSLFIRARQIIINYANNPAITFDHEGPEIPIDTYNATIYGPPSDLTFQKVSVLCARMLISSEDDNYNRIGWNILDDMARDRAYSQEQRHFMDYILALRSEYTSIGRNDIHWAPYYTQFWYVNTLEIYFDQITVYNDRFQELLDSAISCEEFVDRAGTLIGIWSDTVVAQSKIVRDHTEATLSISEATYLSMYAHYNQSREELEEAEEVFRAGLEKWWRRNLVKIIFQLIFSIFKMAFGIFPCGIRGLADNLQSTIGRVIHALELLEVTMENLAKTMEELEEFLIVADKMIETGDYSRYMDNVEAVAGLYVLIPEWANFKYQIDVIFREPEFRRIDGAIEYSFACFDLANWGEALTRSTIEYANNVRKFVAADSLYQNKLKMQERYDEYFAAVQENCELQTKTAIKFAEQNYDIMLELNDQLIQYCQAHYYEEMQLCPESAWPNFAYDVVSLLSNINAAKLDAQYYSRRSSAKLDIIIQDDPSATGNCTDIKLCPVQHFRNNRLLYYELLTDHPRFQGIDLFLVDEIEVYIPGAFSDAGIDYVRLLISSSGPFVNRLGEKESIFLTRALTEMKFQYDMTTLDIELRANLYEPDGAMIKHMTPFTTWFIQVDPTFDHIDISNVQEIELILHGPFLNNRDDE